MRLASIARTIGRTAESVLYYAVIGLLTSSLVVIGAQLVLDNPDVFAPGVSAQISVPPIQISTPAPTLSARPTPDDASAAPIETVAPLRGAIAPAPTAPATSSTTPAPTSTTSAPRPAAVLPKTPAVKAVSPKPPAVATWRVLVLLYNHVNAHWRDAKGKSQLIKSDLTADEAAQYQAQVSKLPTLLDAWSGHNVSLRITLIRPTRAITKLDTGCGGPYVGPWDIQADLDRYAPSGSYDSIIVGWSANQAGAKLIPYWGCSIEGMYQEAHGATYSTVRVPDAPFWWTNEAYGPEPLVHEWLLGVSGFFASQGHKMPSIEDGVRHYGYKPGPDGSYRTWYSAYMRGKLNGKLGPVGITRAMWRSGKPTGH